MCVEEKHLNPLHALRMVISTLAKCKEAASAFALHCTLRVVEEQRPEALMQLADGREQLTASPLATCTHLSSSICLWAPLINNF